MNKLNKACAEQTRQFASLRAEVADTKNEVNELALDVTEWSNEMAVFSSDFCDFTREWGSMHEDYVDSEPMRSHRDEGDSRRLRRHAVRATGESESEKKMMLARDIRQKELKARGAKGRKR